MSLSSHASASEGADEEPFELIKADYGQVRSSRLSAMVNLIAGVQGLARTLEMKSAIVSTLQMVVHHDTRMKLGVPGFSLGLVQSNAHGRSSLFSIIIHFTHERKECMLSFVCFVPACRYDCEERDMFHLELRVSRFYSVS